MSVELHTPPQASIFFTDNATRHVVSYLKQNNSSGIRLSVKKTGCSGLSYVVDFVKQALTDDVTFPLQDEYLIYVARSSLPFLQGLTVDYVKQGLNYKFVFSNPNQTGQCGCGESFTVE